MKKEELSKRVGTYLKASVVAGESYSTYVPQKLPPNPALDIEELLPLLEKAISAISRLDGRIVKEITGKERNKIFVYGEYLEILNQGTEPLRH